ncbi:MAG TPA: S9 family peptidase [Ohtaekwangia sp.]|uniref:S9 family peptidase n=1 Tax=Ohtaekwangia sp. TaxID=2066019 RepID=UPI002F9572D4
MKRTLLFTLLLCVACTVSAQRAMRPSDVYKLKSVSDPQLSPDGNWIAYVVSTPDSAKDKYDSDVWMINWEGTESLRLTTSAEGESRPRWSPDGKYLTFLSSRYETKSSQIWKLDRRGGEAVKLTELKYGISDYIWSPDAKKIALIIKDQESVDDRDKKKTTPPIVMDRYHFKSDGDGYLERKREHLYLFDVESKKLDTLTKGDFDVDNPIWSPDSKQLAFVSNRTPDADRNANNDIWIIDAKKGSTPRQLTTWKGADTSPAWSPDGKYIAYLQSRFEDFNIYDQPYLAYISVTGGTPVLLSQKVDRDISSPRWSADSQALYVAIEDDRTSHITSFDLAGNHKAITSGEQVFFTPQGGINNRWVMISSDPRTPNEVYALDNGKARRVTHIHDDFLKSLNLATVKGFNSVSKDGTVVGGLLYWPAGKPSSEKLPLILWIHGGPTSQDDYSFDLTSQMFAAKGYAVANVNYRGSNGKGLAFSKAIFADWGNKEVMDILGAADYLVKIGAADPNRLGIGGWSYGGILTDYTTATDTRFKAAASGAGSALQLSMYGSDQYTLQYEKELGVPWKNVDKWMKVSYPFFKADKIKTPTLYMVGEKDFNVPAAGSEQMYQALKTLGVPTQFVVYPGQFHGISVPSYQIDRFTRWTAWYDQYLGNGLNQTLPPKK